MSKQLGRARTRVRPTNITLRDSKICGPNRKPMDTKPRWCTGCVTRRSAFLKGGSCRNFTSCLNWLRVLRLFSSLFGVVSSAVASAPWSWYALALGRRHVKVRNITTDDRSRMQSRGNERPRSRSAARKCLFQQFGLFCSDVEYCMTTHLVGIDPQCRPLLLPLPRWALPFLVIGTEHRREAAAATLVRGCSRREALTIADSHECADGVAVIGLHGGPDGDR
mmetsp:Transcript_77033/g.221287  ORF Transcript_77033/g.221287 Transcript_77033/m.221287 type:complete len:222 (+) Transcript_77033:156-821(+)